LAGNGAGGVEGEGTLHGGAAEDAARLDEVPSPDVPVSGVLSSAASPIVAATSIGVFNLLVSSHTNAMSRETN